ncbi:hypothetical protein [Streptomyces odonnellii]|uniref:hypothetical protein n=1 Tax=Streptomyces odonnellii TaxID=1417980 RepID=UPI000625D197|nr:hypothetical protein [Streptomyces odonnellii]
MSRGPRTAQADAGVGLDGCAADARTVPERPRETVRERPRNALAAWATRHPEATIGAGPDGAEARATDGTDRTDDKPATANSPCPTGSSPRTARCSRIRPRPSCR